jgi:hypothetical protein
MSFWDWLAAKLSGKPNHVEVANDLVWINQIAKFEGLRRAADQSVKEAALVLVVAHFPGTLTQVRQAFAGRAVEDLGNQTRITPADLMRRADKGAGPCLTLATTLVDEDLAGPAQPEPGLVSILVAERHFVRANDDWIVTFAGCLPRRCRVTFHSSLDDALLRATTGDWLKGVLAQLGMTESEPIASRMVARRIRTAQARFASHADQDRRVESAEQWLEQNPPH